MTKHQIIRIVNMRNKKLLKDKVFMSLLYNGGGAANQDVKQKLESIKGNTFNYRFNKGILSLKWLEV